jgi:integrase
MAKATDSASGSASTGSTTLDERIQQTNQRLKAAQMGLQIERRGDKLSLRGTLPPKPGSDRQKPHQQRIRLGLPATAAGLKQAEQTIKIIAAELIQNTFSWNHYAYGNGWQRLDQLTLAEQIQAFEEHFRAEPQRSGNPSSTKVTWQFAYAPYLRKLLAIAQDTPSYSLVEAIYATVRSIPAQARSRQVCCTALASFAEFVQIELPADFQRLWGSYRQAQLRQLPTDELIVATWETIPNPAWRFVYGIMATYGLRNHEVFFCDYSGLGQPDLASATIVVQESTKTGCHEVWPFYPDWIERFHLTEVQIPPIQTDLSQTTLQRIGQLVSVQFRRYGIPFSPYDLRHAWAVRTIHVGLPDSVAARMMGHSVTVHTRTYHQWMTHRDQQQAVNTALKTIQLPD